MQFLFRKNKKNKQYIFSKLHNPADTQRQEDFP